MNAAPHEHILYFPHGGIIGFLWAFSEEKAWEGRCTNGPLRNPFFRLLTSSWTLQVEGAGEDVQPYRYD